MNENTEFGYKTRQILNEGVDALDKQVTVRLHEARQAALNGHRPMIAGLRLAGIGHSMELAFFSHARNLLAVMALVIGAMGTYYWDAYEQAREYEEIDSALLADELPPSAYLDRGFHAWLEHASDSSLQ
ncbi:MAG: DUF3619 family protein [Sulfuritalea sp.]|nr:DUF3619 family protein [Sulfuritalea sp.]MDP1981174.1 DUF3619 family protein [Sulfuritalea sp.]